MAYMEAYHRLGVHTASATNVLTGVASAVAEPTPETFAERQNFPPSKFCLSAQRTDTFFATFFSGKFCPHPKFARKEVNFQGVDYYPFATDPTFSQTEIHFACS